MATVSISGSAQDLRQDRRRSTGSTVDIADGEFFVILGPSGAGKTTTLKSIAGLVDVDGGIGRPSAATT